MTRSTATAPSPHRRSTTLLALGLPLAVLGTAAALALSWKDALPDPVATHWGTGGVDGFSSLDVAIAVPLAIAAVTVVGLWAFSWRSGSASSTRRIANGTAVWLTLFLSALLLGMLDAQRGLADAADVGPIGGAIALALVIATVGAVLAALLTPAGASAPTDAPVPAGASRLPLATDERAMWFQRSRSGVGAAVVALAAAAMAATAVVTNQWWMLLVTVALLVLAAATLSWVVRADETGLSVRSALGVPRSRIPLDEVVQARATTVRCFREFGGWGWRTALDGRTGIVLRSGDTLEVTRTGGSVFVVTVDDAATGAALLNTLADRLRPGHAAAAVE